MNCRGTASRIALMLITVSELHRTYGVRAHGVLHVGAHEAEESADYAAHSWGPVIWVEMLPEKFEYLREHFRPDPDIAAGLDASAGLPAERDRALSILDLAQYRPVAMLVRIRPPKAVDPLHGVFL